MGKPLGPMSSESAGSPEFSESIRPTQTKHRPFLTALAAGLLLFLIPVPARSEHRVVEGTLEVLTADDFAGGRATTLFALVTDRHEVFGLRFAQPRPELKTGLRVSVSGESRGRDLAVETLRVLPPRLSAAAMAISGATSVLVILLKWKDTTTEPYTVAFSQNRVFGATDSAKKYYEENSFGSHTLTGP